MNVGQGMRCSYCPTLVTQATPRGHSSITHNSTLLLVYPGDLPYLQEVVDQIKIRNKGAFHNWNNTRSLSLYLVTLTEYTMRELNRLHFFRELMH